MEAYEADETDGVDKEVREDVGILVGKIYCSEKWWDERCGRIPENVKLRPTNGQRKDLCNPDLFFEDFHTPSNALRQTQRFTSKWISRCCC